MVVPVIVLENVAAALVSNFKPLPAAFFISKLASVAKTFTPLYQVISADEAFVPICVKYAVLEAPDPFLKIIPIAFVEAEPTAKFPLNVPVPASIQVVNLPTGEQTAVLP